MTPPPPSDVSFFRYTCATLSIWVKSFHNRGLFSFPRSIPTLTGELCPLCARARARVSRETLCVSVYCFVRGGGHTHTHAAFSSSPAARRGSCRYCGCFSCPTPPHLIPRSTPLTAAATNAPAQPINERARASALQEMCTFSVQCNIHRVG